MAPGTALRTRLCIEDKPANFPVIAGIALSADAMARDVAKGMAAGCFRWLNKTIKEGELMHTLDLAFEETDATKARARAPAEATP